jgi:hypothetical protein
MPEHETRLNPPVEGGDYICRHHENAMNNVFDAMAKKVGYMQMVWVAGVLSAVAGAFGFWLCSRNDAVEMRANLMERDMAVVKNDLEHIKDAQTETRSEQHKLRADMKQEFERLRQALRTRGVNP